MSVTMRILQQFDVRHEADFMELERKFAELERRRPDYPKGRRLQPISATMPCNTFIWECEFPTWTPRGQRWTSSTATMSTRRCSRNKCNSSNRCALNFTRTLTFDHKDTKTQRH